MLLRRGGGQTAEEQDDCWDGSRRNVSLVGLENTLWSKTGRFCSSGGVRALCKRPCVTQRDHVGEIKVTRGAKLGEEEDGNGLEREASAVTDTSRFSVSLSSGHRISSLQLKSSQSSANHAFQQCVWGVCVCVSMSDLCAWV